MIGGDWLPVTLTVISGSLLFSAIAAAWFRFARHDIPLSSLISLVGYLLWKIPLYFKFLVKPQSDWVRTERAKAKPTPQK